MTGRPWKNLLWSPDPRFCAHGRVSGAGPPFEWTSSLLPHLLVCVCVLSPVPYLLLLLPFGLCFTSSGILLASLLLAFSPSSHDWVSCLSFRIPDLPFSLSTLLPGSSGLHRDAVWPRSRGRVHHGLQLPVVRAAGLCHCPVQLRQQAGLRVAAASCPLGLPSLEWSCPPACLWSSPTDPLYIGPLPGEPLARWAPGLSHPGTGSSAFAAEAEEWGACGDQRKSFLCPHSRVSILLQSCLPSGAASSAGEVGRGGGERKHKAGLPRPSVHSARSQMTMGPQQCGAR